jgi:lipid A disaccharide synthetase
LLANKEVVPEFIQHRAEPHRIADEMRILVDDSIAREQMISEFDTVIGQVGGGGASQTAARAILEEIGNRSSAVITR